MITNQQSGTRIDEIRDGIYRISTPVPPTVVPGGFSFNQYLIADDEPLLYHSGPRKMFPLVQEAVSAVLPVASLRYLGLSHFEADECGALNDFLAVAPRAEGLCSAIAKMVSLDDFASRPVRALGDGEEVSLGARTVRWLDTPHFPHGWECGHLFETTTRTLFCGDLFTQGGHEHAPVTTGDILEASEAMRAQLDYYSHTGHVDALTEKVASTEPRLLACMHGSAWEGDGSALLRRLGRSLAA